MKEEIESRFHLLITISLFFPVLLANMDTIAGQTAEKASLILIQTSTVVGLYLIDYLLFQNRKNELTKKSFERINLWLLVALGIFIIPIVGITTLTLNLPSWIAFPAAWLSGASMFFILAAPPVIEFIIIFSGGRKK